MECVLLYIVNYDLSSLNDLDLILYELYSTKTWISYKTKRLYVSKYSCYIYFYYSSCCKNVNRVKIVAKNSLSIFDKKEQLFLFQTSVVAIALIFNYVAMRFNLTDLRVLSFIET